MFLERLESGFLLYETQQGLVRVELSFQQRIYLLWTFRHFRQLSVLLLNARQRALVDNLFRNNIGLVPHLNDSWPVIGMIENFVPPPGHMEAALSGEAALRREEPRSILEAPIHWENNGGPEEPEPQTAELATQIADTALQRPSVPTPFPFGWPRLATAAAILSLILLSVAAWYRIQGMPGSQANFLPPVQRIETTSQAETFASTQSPVIAETPVLAPVPAPAVEPLAPPKVAAEPVKIAAIGPKPRPASREQDTVTVSPANQPLTAMGRSVQVSRPPLRFVYPVYPNIRVRGGVALTAQVDSEGVVRGVRVVSGNRALAAAALRAVRQWRYRPYIKDGQPIATETNILISFISEDAISMTFPPAIPATR